MALAWKLAVALVAIYLFIVLATVLLQRRLIYFPEPRHITPASVGLTNVSERVLKTPDRERVLVWYGAAQPGQPTILYFHGNGGSFGLRDERIRRYMAQGYGVYMMTYRSYGGSTGNPSERNNVADARLAYESLKKEGVEPDNIVIYGESLGTGVAVQLASEVSAAGVILDAPYTSLVDIAEKVYPYLPSRWLMTDRYETMNYIGKVKEPLLILHGEEDEIVPVSMGRAIYEAANQPKTLKVFPGAGHSNHSDFGSYEAAFAWLRELKAGNGNVTK